jgi:hypothetical protein
MKSQSSIEIGALAEKKPTLTKIPLIVIPIRT